MGEHKPIRHRQAKRSREFKTMSGYAGNVPWWKEPTKDQWYAYCAAWMGWTLDAFDFTVFLLIMAPIAQEFGVPLIGRDRDLLGHAGHAPGWSDGIRLAGRSDGAPSASDDLHSLVFHLQFPRRLLAKLCLPVCDPGTAGHRHGGGMAGRRGAGDGILAGAVSRADVRRLAGVLGVGLRTVRPGLRLPVWTVGSMA